MDAQLTLLQEIRSAVWILVYLVGAGVLLSLVRAVATSYRTIRTELANAFSNTASAMFDRGQYESLIKYCHEHLKKNPKEAYAYWFLGKAHHQLKKYDKAVEYLNKAKEIFPSWEKDWVGPILEKIEAERKSPLTTGSRRRRR
jgi:tetratricopeptide (TPR) repeat protein